MEPKIIDGKSLALKHTEELLKKVARLPRMPRVVSLLLGDDPASHLYTDMKQKKAQELGINFSPLLYPVTLSYSDLIGKVQELNNSDLVDGIMIQLPIPKQILGEHTPDEVIDLINPDKDVDGLTGRGRFLPATVRAVLSILASERVEVLNKQVVVIGRSREVGKPLTEQLRKMGATVNVGNRQVDPQELKQWTRQASLIISATGQPHIVDKSMIGDNYPVVIDVGTTRVNGKIVGDVDFENVLPLVSKITPAIGGVGPMTVISLMENVIEAFEKRVKEG